MKTRQVIESCLAVTMVLRTLSSLAMAMPTTFQDAYQNGAKARIVFQVIDDDGNPVRDAQVNVFFDMANRSKARRIIGTTDANGAYVAQEKTKGVLKIQVSREGYYRSNDLISFIDMGHEHEVKNGKWQPWGMVKKIVLRPIRNPVACRVELNDWLRTKVLNEWIGFDLEKCDFIAPVGKGNFCDFEIKFDWDGMFGTKHNGMAVSLKFADKFSGGYYANRSEWSTFTGVYVANPRKTYSRYFHYYSYPIRDPKGLIVDGKEKRFDQSKALVVRSRCVVDAKGDLISARYFQIEKLRFACNSQKEAVLGFDLIYNPTPNDTNLEPK